MACKSAALHPAIPDLASIRPFPPRRACPWFAPTRRARLFSTAAGRKDRDRAFANLAISDLPREKDGTMADEIFEFQSPVRFPPQQGAAYRAQRSYRIPKGIAFSSVLH